MEKKTNPWIGFIPYLICIAVVMLCVMVSAPAFPLIMADYSLTAAEQPWQNTMYTLGAAVLAPLVCWYGDRKGMKQALLLGLVIFAVGMAGSALSPNYLMFCVCSVLRGFATAAIFPATMYYIATSFSQEKSVGAYAMMTAASSLGCAIGPMIAGVLVDLLGWRKVFMACAVLVALCFVIVIFGVKKHPGTDPNKKLDSIGSLLLLVLFGAFLSALTLAAQLGWFSPAVLGLLALTVVATILFIRHESKAEVTLIRVGLFKKPGFVMPTMLYFCQNGLAAFHGTAITYFVSMGLGLDASISGTWMFILYLVTFLVSLCAGRVSKIISEKALVLLCVSFWAIGIGICCVCGATTPVWVLYLIAVAFALGNAFMPGIAQAIALRNVEPSEASMASGTITMITQAGSPIIIALVIPYLTILGAENGIPNYAVSFGKTAMLMLIMIALSFVFAFLTPAKKTVEKA